MTSGQNDAIGHLFHPNNVVLVGASDRPGHWSQRVYDNLKRFGFAGKVFPVNPNRSDIWGTPCYPTLEALPETPDHLAIFTPAETTIKILEDGGAAGARSATVYAAGFGEGGDPDGRKRGAQLRAAIERSGMAVIGPTCMGVACGAANFATIPDESLQRPMPSPVAIAVQSGAMATVINRAVNDLGLKTAYLASCGSQLGCRISDFIDYFATLPELRVILCYIEGVPDTAHFLEAARRARANGKVIVAVKIGGSETSRAAALAHTGSLAGSLQCFDAVAETVGVIRVDTLDEAVEAAEYFSHAPTPKGPRLVGMTFSGGLKGLMLEAAERHGLSFPPLAPETLAKVGEVLGVGTSLGNPLDAGFAALSSAEAYFKCIEILRADPNIDVLLLQEELPPVPRTNNKVDNLIQVDRMMAENQWPPIAIVSMISYMFTDYTREFRAKLPNLPVLQEVDKALKAVGAAGRYGALRAQTAFAPPESGRTSKPNIAGVLKRRTKAADGFSVLNEADSKELLRAYGIRTPREVIAGSADTAIMAAKDIGYPVVLKLLAAEVQHKSDIGGVILGIRSDNELRAAYTRLAQNLAKARPGAKLEQVIVAEQVSGGVELVLGVQRDPEVGPVVMFGSGGINLELHKDVAFGAVPLPLWQAKAMIERTTAGKLLKGYRGTPAGDEGSVLAALLALGRLAHDLGDQVESVDINPVVALPDGQGAVALDALVVLRG